MLVFLLTTLFVFGLRDPVVSNVNYDVAAAPPPGLSLRRRPGASDSDDSRAPSDSDDSRAPSDSDDSRAPSDSADSRAATASDSDDSKASSDSSDEPCVPTTTDHHGPHHVSQHGPHHVSQHGPHPCPRAAVTASPTLTPTPRPTLAPTHSPTTASPTVVPTLPPTLMPTPSPTLAPTLMPTKTPTWSPTRNPTHKPTVQPTVMPTPSPSFGPTVMPTPSPSFGPTVMPTSSPSFGPSPAPTPTPTTATPTFGPTPYPLGDVQPDQGCSNAADITLVEMPGLDAEACKAECDAYGFGCHAAMTTVGVVAWGTGHTQGGYDDVFTSPALQSLLQGECKVTSCGSSSEVQQNDACKEHSDTAFCKPAGQNGCPPDEACTSVGPASHCVGELSSHTAEECVDSSQNYQGSITIGDTLVMDTGNANTPIQVAPAYCAPAPSSSQEHARSCFGPYQDSAPFDALAGDTISWEYKAEGGQDWYEVMVIILRDGVPVALPTHRFGSKIDDFRIDSWTVDQDSANYVIRFVVGSYDYSGYQALGASMEVKKFGRVDPQGNGYAICRLLGSGCNQVEISGGGGLATRDPTTRRRTA